MGHFSQFHDCIIIVSRRHKAKDASGAKISNFFRERTLPDTHTSHKTKSSNYGFLIDTIHQPLTLGKKILIHCNNIKYHHRLRFCFRASLAPSVSSYLNRWGKEEHRVRFLPLFKSRSSNLVCLAGWDSLLALPQLMRACQQNMQSNDTCHQCPMLMTCWVWIKHVGHGFWLELCMHYTSGENCAQVCQS